VYSLVSAPVLGFDLTRMPGGSSAALILGRALTLTAADLSDLADRRIEPARHAELWGEVQLAELGRPTVRDLAAISRLTAGAPTAEGPHAPEAARSGAAAAMTLLERAPLGTLNGLMHCVRHDVLDWTWSAGGSAGGSTGKSKGGSAPHAPPVQSAVAAAATEVVCDAVAGSYLHARLAETVRRELTAGWVAAAHELPIRTIDLGPGGVAAHRLIDRVAGLDDQDRDRVLAAAAASRRESATWAPAIHSASWAVHLAGRVRAAAAAQFLLVDAVDAGRIPVAERAGWAWNLLSGAVQALMARDLMDAGTTHRLLSPLLPALGPTVFS
jgi:hypothetical protein